MSGLSEHFANFAGQRLVSGLDLHQSFQQRQRALLVSRILGSLVDRRERPGMQEYRLAEIRSRLVLSHLRKRCNRPKQPARRRRGDRSPDHASLIAGAARSGAV